MAAVLSLTLQAVNTITYTATYDMSKSSLGSDTLGGVTYTTVNYDGLFNGGEPGAPSLPVDYIRFSVPYNATNFSVNAVLGNSMISSIPHLVYPCQQPRMMEDTVPWSITLPDNSIYNSGSYYPDNNSWVVDEGFLAGENHIVTVAVMPISFRYTKNGHLTTRLLRKSQSVSLTLSYELSDTPNIYPLVRKDSLLRQEGHKFTRGMVVNPDSVITFAPLQTITETNDLLLIDPINPNPGVMYYDEMPYLIITTSDYLHSIRRIKAFKEQLGYRVNVVTLDEIANHIIAGQGDKVLYKDSIIIDTTTVGKIRRYLKYAYSTQNTKYVLLLGNGVPYKVQDNVATDWYYYDLNSNSVKGIIDTYPDLNVGRILAKTPKQFSNYTDKVLRYCINPGKGNYSYLKRAIVTQGSNLDKEGSFYSIVSDSLSMVFPFISYIKELENQEYPKGLHVIDSINSNHYAFMSSLNHGSSTAIRVYGPDSYGKRYFIWALEDSKYNFDTEIGNSLDCMNNKNYPMIYYSLSCSTMPYGYNGTSFAESFTTGEDYGGPVYIGNTNTVHANCSNETFGLFLSELRNANHKVGLAYSLSKKGFDGSFFNRNRQDALAHNLIGDPSIDVWTDEPQCFSDITVLRGDSTITITGLVVDSTIVAICGNRISDKLITKTVSDFSVTFNRVSANSNVTLYKHNYIPYFAPLLLQNVNLCSQYVIASDVTAGYSIDSNRSYGNVIIPQDVEYEIEASGVVRLEDGFSVAKGATFAVYPSSF